MKYMRLGSKPDTFRTNISNNITTVANDLPSDLTIQVDDHIFYLHKFPILSKCGRLQKLGARDRDRSAMAPEEEDPSNSYRAGAVRLTDMPGGAEAFGLCARFCYGIAITLNAHNILIARCAAEYLEMKEDMEKGNLVFKLEVFLSSSVLKSWKDSIFALKSTRATVSLGPWPQDLQLVSRCIDAIASKTSVDPSIVDWSFTYTRKRPEGSSSSSSSSRRSRSRRSHVSAPNATAGATASPRKKLGLGLAVPCDWWVEDICDLDVDWFYRVMVSIKAKGRMCGRFIGEALRVYAYIWLPGISKQQQQQQQQRQQHAHMGSTTNIGSSSSSSSTSSSSFYYGQDVSCPPAHRAGLDHKLVLETIVRLLPRETGSCSCSFMTRLLKAGAILGVDDTTRLELARRIGLQLHEASLHDMLIPCLSYANDSLYDVDLVHHILEHFLLGALRPSPRSQCSDHQRLPRPQSKELERLCNPTSMPPRVGTDDSDDFLEFDESIDEDGSSGTAHDMNVIPESSVLKVGKLIDGYLSEIARDPNLPLAKFVALAETIPAFARPVHDDLYKAIDIYLKEHPHLTKNEKKRVCGLIDCKKLSPEVSMHVAQNERLPLRVVVQVLFFEQARTTIMARKAGLKNEDELPPSSHGHNHNIMNNCIELDHHGPTNNIMNDPVQGALRACKPSLKTNVFSNSKKIFNKILSIYSSSGVSIGSINKLDSNVSKSSGGGSSGVSMSSNTTTIAPSKVVESVDSNLCKAPTKAPIRHRHSIS